MTDEQVAEKLERFREQFSDREILYLLEKALAEIVK